MARRRLSSAGRDARHSSEGGVSGTLVLTPAQLTKARVASPAKDCTLAPKDTLLLLDEQPALLLKPRRPDREGRAALGTYELNGSSVEPRYSGHFFDGFFPLTMAMTG